MKKRNERKGGNDFSFSYQSEFVFLSQTFESWRLGHVRRTSDRASACTQAPRMFYRLVICFLSSCTLFMVSFKLMLFLFFFHFYYPYIPSVMDWVQFLSKFLFSVSLLYFTWYLYIHLFGPLSNIFDKSNKIKERALCRLWPLLWSRCHFRLQNDIFLSSFSWLSKNACDLIRVKESQKKNGTIQKSLFTKPDKEARLIVQLWECLLLGRLWHRWIY